MAFGNFNWNIFANKYANLTFFQATPLIHLNIHTHTANQSRKLFNTHHDDPFFQKTKEMPDQRTVLTVTPGTYFIPAMSKCSQSVTLRNDYKGWNSYSLLHWKQVQTIS